MWHRIEVQHLFISHTSTGVVQSSQSPNTNPTERSVNTKEMNEERMRDEWGTNNNEPWTNEDNPAIWRRSLSHVIANAAQVSSISVLRRCARSRELQVKEGPRAAQADSPDTRMKCRSSVFHFSTILFSFIHLTKFPLNLKHVKIIITLMGYLLKMYGLISFHIQTCIIHFRV